MAIRYEIYRPGCGLLLGEFCSQKNAEQAAYALDRYIFKTKKAYERAKNTGALHQVREVVENEQKTG